MVNWVLRWAATVAEKGETPVDAAFEPRSFLDSLKWNEKGLIPAIVQDAENGQVLMMAWMDEAALRETLATGLTHFFSRSRRAQWHKGSTSGHVQHVESVWVDCDGDAILVKARQVGGACHKGYRSCFFRRVTAEGNLVREGDIVFDPQRGVRLDSRKRLMRKPRLMTPGPAMVPEDVLLELARPVFHHRSDEAKDVITDVIAGLKEVFQTQNDVLILTASGTGAMEAAAVNTVPPGGKAIVLSAGHFAARWANICKAFGINAVVLETEWGQPVDPDSVAAALKQHPDTDCVMGTLSETSTGTGHPVAAIGRIVAQTPAVFAVDGISGVGAMECRTDEWGIDLLCVGSQKALMIPPGLAFVSVSAKAWAKIDRFDSHSYYFNLKAARKKIKEFDTPYTPAHTLILALRTALRRIKDEGIENVWRRHQKMSEACQAGVTALGLELFSARPAEGLTAFRVPDGLKDSQIRNKLYDRFGIYTVGGQDRLKGKIIRIGHMGYTDELDVIGTLAALEMTLGRAWIRYRARPCGRCGTAGFDRTKECRRGRLILRANEERNLGTDCPRERPDPLPGTLVWQSIVCW